MTPEIGDRIRLIHTNDRYSKLKRGDLGSITDVIYLPEDNGGQVNKSYIKAHQRPTSILVVATGIS